MAGRVERIARGSDTRTASASVRSRTRCRTRDRRQSRTTTSASHAGPGAACFPAGGRCGSARVSRAIASASSASVWPVGGAYAVQRYGWPPPHARRTRLRSAPAWPVDPRPPEPSTPIRSITQLRVGEEAEEVDDSGGSDRERFAAVQPTRASTTAMVAVRLCGSMPATGRLVWMRCSRGWRPRWKARSPAAGRSGMSRAGSLQATRPGSALTRQARHFESTTAFQRHSRSESEPTASNTGPGSNAPTDPRSQTPRSRSWCSQGVDRLAIHA